MQKNPNMQSVDPVSVVEGLITLIEDDFSRRGIRIFTSFDSRTAKCGADPGALRQVFLDLLSNAADAVQGKSDANIFICVNRLGKMIEIKLVDNGAGMDESQPNNFFGPFFPSKETLSRLVTVEKMMASMDGSISINSELDIGTEVSLLLEASND